MYPNVALGDLASCGTRQVRAKLFGRVHRLCLVLHIYRMPLNASFFKSSFPFHRLVELYHLELLAALIRMRIIGMFERAALCVKNNVDEIITQGEREKGTCRQL